MASQSENNLIEAAAAPSTGLALASMSPEQFVTETYAPFLETMDVQIAEAEAAAGAIDITTTSGMKEAIRWRAVFRDDFRLKIEEKRRAAKAPLLAAGKLIDSRAAELVEKVQPLEVHFHERIKAEEKRKDDERAAAIEANRQRVAALDARLLAITSAPANAAGKASGPILAERDRIAAIEIGEDWQEFAERAAGAQREAVAKLEDLYRAALAAEEAAAAEAAAREAERQRIAAEQAELARQRAEQEAAQRQLAEQRAQLEREQAEARRRAQEAEAERQRLADAQAAELKRQSDELAAARAAFEEEQNRIAAARRAAEELERDHAEALEMNAAWQPQPPESIVLDDVARAKMFGTPGAAAPEWPPIAAAGVTIQQHGMLLMDDELCVQQSADVREGWLAPASAQQAAPAELLDVPEAEPTDEEIVAAYIDAFGGTPEQAIERLHRFGMEAA